MKHFSIMDYKVFFMILVTFYDEILHIILYIDNTFEKQFEQEGILTVISRFIY